MAVQDDRREKEVCKLLALREVAGRIMLANKTLQWTQLRTLIT